MIIHKDSVDESLLNQLKSYFQTVIYSVSKTSLLSSPNSLKYVIDIESKNLKSSKFNVHTNVNDLQIKNELVLPYELIG